jgi:outer membrane biogenesis lipoprotein LolB
VRSFHRVLLLPAAFLLLAACTQKPRGVLDGDTALEMQSSIQMVRANLNTDRQEEFDQAVATIIYSAKDRRFTQNADRLTPESIRMLKGLNANQVIETAKLLRTVSAG